MKALPTFEGRSSARTWLLSIARHTVLDHLRSQSRRPRIAALADWAAAADVAHAGTGPQFDEQILLEQLIAGLDPNGGKRLSPPRSWACHTWTPRR
jgi:RNA polymerase sigma-70 factor (ECF subfamily)